MRHRWCLSGLLRADEGFRKIRGFRDLPQLPEFPMQLSGDNQNSSQCDLLSAKPSLTIQLRIGNPPCPDRTGIAFLQVLSDRALG